MAVFAVVKTVAPWVAGLAIAHYGTKAIDGTADVAENTATLADSLTRLAIVSAVAYGGYVITKRVI